MKTLLLSLLFASSALAGYSPRPSSGIDQSNVAITGGTINGAVIGGTTPAAVTSTTLTNSDLLTIFATGKDHIISNNWSGNNVGAIWNKNSGGLSALRYLNPAGHERSAAGYADIGAPFGNCYYIETNSYLNGPPSNPPASEDLGQPVVPIRFVTTGLIGSDFAFYNRGEFRDDGLFAINRASLNGLQGNSSPVKPVWEVGSAAATGATAYLYNSYTDTSNYERAAFKFASNVLVFGTDKAGTGSTRALQITIGGTNICNFATTGHLLWNTDNTYDIGASGATRPRNIYAGGTVYGVNLHATGAGSVFDGGEIGFNGSGGDQTGTAAAFYVGGTTTAPVRLVRGGVAKVDFNINNGGAGARLDFRDTDNGGIIPLSVRVNGSGIVSVLKLNISSIPTSASGLSSGDVYSNAGILTIVP